VLEGLGGLKPLGRPKIISKLLLYPWAFGVHLGFRYIGPMRSISPFATEVIQNILGNIFVTLR
jgi:hypothetical protein